MTVIDIQSLSSFVFLVSQIVLDIGSGHPVVNQEDISFLPKTLKRLERSFQPDCSHKKHLREREGIIIVNSELREHTKPLSCSWIIHATRGQSAHLEFSKFDIDDPCPGICQCNYIAVKESRKRRIKKYCNERKPPQGLTSGSKKVRVHLRLNAGSQTGGFVLSYSSISDEKRTKFSPQKSDKRRYSRNQDSGANKVRVRKLVPTVEARTAKPTEDPGPSKLTILLAVAIPVVLIFLLVVLLIAYYNYYTDKQTESGEELPKSGTTISDLIMNSSVTLTPMFNLSKARRESSQRKEKASKLYDDMLQNWRQVNADKKLREKAKEESVYTWDSYKKYKQRRNTREVEPDSDSQAFAMLVSNAINVATTPPPTTEEAQPSNKPDIDETIEEVEEKPRTNSILVRRDSSDAIRNSRGSKVLSWSDISTNKPKEEGGTETKRTKSETELKSPTTRREGSTHIPAIVVSQPSIETEDDESEANDTDRLIKDNKDLPKKTTDQGAQAKAATSYSCSEHVKEILRESYGDEMDELFQKPKKSVSQGSLQHIPDSNVKYQAMKTTEDDDDVD